MSELDLAVRLLRGSRLKWLEKESRCSLACDLPLVVRKDCMPENWRRFRGATGLEILVVTVVDKLEHEPAGDGRAPGLLVSSRIAFFKLAILFRISDASE